MNYEPSTQAETTATTEEALDRAVAARVSTAAGGSESRSEAHATSGMNAEAQPNGTKPAVRKQAPAV
ncbi:hypothetical protein [Streptomyces aurantiogriseus]|uniref:Uncharacterized protein n=1 Tax=Streptomyces aurantiogriseus TaxID=66870 RepID=A0A918EYV3_9ACTN|nr:hypothetical protein [Streptomyces aurantiogriseus]GGQ91843.1 hypothetical protein GCM10010251_03010 [Streptomyces aurantiogriseus]